MKISHVTLDSSFLVSFFLANENHHLKSKGFMEYALKKGIIFLLPIVVLFEVFHTLQRIGFLKDDYESEQFKTFFNLPSFQYFDLDMHFFNLFKELPLFNSLKTNDAIIAASSFLNQSLLITWDNQLLKNAGNAFDPEEFMQKFT